MTSLREVGIIIPKIYESFVAQAGGFNLVTFTKQDMYNEVRRQRGMQNGDVSAAIRYLEYVLAFDATYGRNKYNLPIVVFSGVNHHNQTCVFECAMVSCKTQESYIWLFRHCMLADMEVDEFEVQWEAMLDECRVCEVEWVKDLYRKNCMGDSIHQRPIFHRHKDNVPLFVESRYGVLEFVTNFQRCIDFLRDNEDELEFRSWYGTPVLQTEFVELEKDRWTKYTREMFWRFCEALKRCVRIHICKCNENAEGEVYVVQKYRRPKKKWEVSRQNVGNKFSCTCLRIESFELPCVHILVVLVRLDYTIIPTTLVLHRWSKTAKLHYGLNCTGNETHEQTTTYRSRLEAFAQLCT
ncbi:hypothetical protein Ahy_B06g081912 [Arachis hypogaea]|uniref:SWIM-type domain-containing protein n=1 Tax=Arachis hypogaea TaxID=3818 RepID=A0A444YMD2_ARAHY|nr:hypothetical protein Ahy_B06g081912 [Arachis hypogaea]